VEVAAYSEQVEPLTPTLPHKGGGSLLSKRHRVIHGATPVAFNLAAYFTASMIFT
jgi:hypothetical protein